MNKKILVFVLGIAGILWMVSSLAEAQSTAEYSTLVSTVAAAAKGKKGSGQGQAGEEGASAGASGLASEAMTKLYGESSQGLSTKGGALLGQVGEAAPAAPAAPPATPPAPQENQPSAENQPPSPQEAQNPQPQKETSPPETPSAPTIKLYLKSGTVVEGELLERTDVYIKVNTAGTPVTYFNEEITRVEEPSANKK